MPTILSGSFFLIINCLFACFDRISALSVKSGCHITPARGTRNFDIMLFSSGNRHKFTSMFNCASLVHPCTIVACCQTKFQVPLTVLTRHPYFDEQYQDSVKHGKDCFYQKRKMNYLERWYFIIGKSMHMEYCKIPLYKLYPFPQSPVYRKEKEPLYEPVNYHLHLFFPSPAISAAAYSMPTGFRRYYLGKISVH